MKWLKRLVALCVLLVVVILGYLLGTPQGSRLSFRLLEARFPHVHASHIQGRLLGNFYMERLYIRGWRFEKLHWQLKTFTLSGQSLWHSNMQWFSHWKGKALDLRHYEFTSDNGFRAQTDLQHLQLEWRHYHPIGTVWKDTALDGDASISAHLGNVHLSGQWLGNPVSVEVKNFWKSAGSMHWGDAFLVWHPEKARWVFQGQVKDFGVFLPHLYGALSLNGFYHPVDHGLSLQSSGQWQEQQVALTLAGHLSNLSILLNTHGPWGHSKIQGIYHQQALRLSQWEYTHEALGTLTLLKPVSWYHLHNYWDFPRTCWRQGKSTLCITLRTGHRWKCNIEGGLSVYGQPVSLAGHWEQHHHGPRGVWHFSMPSYLLSTEQLQTRFTQVQAHCRFSRKRLCELRGKWDQGQIKAKVMFYSDQWSRDWKSMIAQYHFQLTHPGEMIWKDEKHVVSVSQFSLKGEGRDYKHPQVNARARFNVLHWPEWGWNNNVSGDWSLKGQWPLLSSQWEWRSQDGGVVQGSLSGNFHSLRHPLGLHGKLSGKHFPLIQKPELQLWVSPELQISQGELLWGTVTIDKGVVQPSFEKRSVTQLPDDVTVEELQPATQEEPVYFWQNLGMNVQLLLGEKIYLNANGLKGKVNGKLQIKRVPPGDVLGNGELFLSKGQYFAFGRHLEVPTGRLTFSDSPLSRPRLSLSAQRTLSRVKLPSQSQMNPFESTWVPRTGESSLVVGVQINGFLDHPKVHLFSNPSGLSKSDILSYLLFDQSAGQTGQADLNMLLRAASSLDLGRRDQNALQVELSKRLGLDEVSLENEDSGVGDLNHPLDQTALRLGKHLSDKIYLSYVVGLFKPIGIFRMTYQLDKHWRLQSEADGQNSGVDILYEKH